MKTVAKITNKFFGMLLIGILLIACTKDGDTGPAGLQGPQGEQGFAGPEGEPGKANVIYSDWHVADWGEVNDDYAEFFIDAPQITQQIIDTGLVLVYGQTTSGQFYALPTATFNTMTIENYLVSVTEPGILKIMIRETNNKTIGTPVLAMFRYVIVPDGIPTSGKSATIDFSKMPYQELTTHLKIPD